MVTINANNRLNSVHVSEDSKSSFELGAKATASGVAFIMREYDMAECRRVSSSWHPTLNVSVVFEDDAAILALREDGCRTAQAKLLDVGVRLEGDLADRLRAAYALLGPSPEKFFIASIDAVAKQFADGHHQGQPSSAALIELEHLRDLAEARFGPSLRAAAGAVRG